VALAFTLSKEC